MSPAAPTGVGLERRPGSLLPRVDHPPRRRRAALRSPGAVAVVVAAVLVLPVLLVPAVGTDLAAQVARTRFAAGHPGSAYDLTWYGGVHPAAYSLLAPYLFALLGTRLTAALATLLAAYLVGDALRVARVPRPYAGAAWAAAALVANLVAGRATFAVGVAFGAVAVRLILGGRPRSVPAGAAALLAALASPVAALFVGVVAAALVVTGPRRAGLALGAGAALPLAVSPLLFPEWGVQPMTIEVAISPMVTPLLVAALVGRRHRAVVVACVVYAAGAAAAYLTATPVGSNVERLGLLFCAPVAVALSRRPWRVLAPALALLLAWQVHQPLVDLDNGSDPVADPAYSAALVAQLHRLHADRSRVEAVPEVDHWEAVVLAAHVPLARGWERQLDVQRDGLFYRDHLSAEAYHQWLRTNAVGYVALSDRPPDWAAQQEARLVRAGQPWLRLVWRGPHWALYRVADALPLVQPPARVLRSRPAWVRLSLPRPGDVLLRVRWSPWLRLEGGPGCLRPAGRWTTVHVDRPGRYTVTAPYALPRGSRC